MKALFTRPATPGVATLVVLSLFGPGTPTASAADALPRFHKQVLTDKYYCDGITAGDINRDGKPDIIAGPFWYEGPRFTNRHEIYPAKVFPTEPSPTDSMFSYVWDFNGDGWPDGLVLGRVHLHEAFWYKIPARNQNPGRNTSPIIASRENHRHSWTRTATASRSWLRTMARDGPDSARLGVVH